MAQVSRLLARNESNPRPFKEHSPTLAHQGDTALDSRRPGPDRLADATAAPETIRVSPGDPIHEETVKDLTAGTGLFLADRGQHELTGVLFRVKR